MEFGYYTAEAKLDSLAKKNIDLRYLPQQDELNDLRFNSTFTNKWAKPF